jgi:hypothetical protein
LFYKFSALVSAQLVAIPASNNALNPQFKHHISTTILHHRSFDKGYVSKKPVMYI